MPNGLEDSAPWDWHLREQKSTGQIRWFLQSAQVVQVPNAVDGLSVQRRWCRENDIPVSPHTVADVAFDNGRHHARGVKCGSYRIGHKASQFLLALGGFQLWFKLASMRLKSAWHATDLEPPNCVLKPRGSAPSPRGDSMPPAIALLVEAPTTIGVEVNNCVRSRNGFRWHVASPGSRSLL